MANTIVNYVIYKAENLTNGEVYIGATTRSIKQRKKDHLECANRKENNKFHMALNAYGAWLFTWKQIDRASSLNELARKEKQYIIAYEAQEYGYNSDSGGGFQKTVYQYDISTGSIVKSYDSLENAANAVNATKKAISKACLNVNNRYGGYYWSYDYPYTVSKDKRNKKLIQMDEDGKIIKEFSSVSEASVFTGINKTSIAKVCRGERNQAGGFYWEYE